jgi:hypothetical protein
MRIVNERMVRDGVFVAIEQLYLEHRSTKSGMDEWRKRGYFKVFKGVQEIVAEARSELRRLEQVVGRLEGVCHRGSTVWSGTAMSPEYDALNREMFPLTGWTTSLLETVMTLQGIIKPDSVPVRMQQISSALLKLHQKRVDAGWLAQKFPGLNLFHDLKELP